MFFERTGFLKRWGRATLAATLFGACAMTPSVSIAEESAGFSEAEIRAIVNRLAKAEEEIQSLRSQVEDNDAAIEQVELRTDVFDAEPTPLYQPLETTQISYLDELPTPGPPDIDAAPAIDQSVLDRLNALEELFAVYEEKSVDQDSIFEALNNDVAGLQNDMKRLVIPGTSNATCQIFGRMHLDYWSYANEDDGAAQFEGEHPQDRFLWRRLRFGVKGKISDQMFYKLEMEFPDPNDFEYRDMYIGWENVPFFQTVIMGNHKRPFGLDHLNSSRYNIFLSRPNVIEAFNEDTRRLGLSSNGITDDLRYNWRFGVWQLERTQDDGQTFGDAYQLQLAGRMAKTYWWDECSNGRGYAHWAIAGAYADPDETGGPRNNNEARFRTRPEARTGDRWLNTGRIANVHDFQIAAVEHVYNYGPFQWVTEYQGLWVERDNGSADAMFHGGYTYVAYMLTGEHMPWERKTGTLGRIKPFENFFWVDTCDGCRKRGWGAWQVAFRYSYLDMNDADIFGGVADSYTTSLVWYWNSNASVQFNWVHGNIRDAAVVNGVGGGGAAVAADSEYDILGVRFRIDY